MANYNGNIDLLTLNEAGIYTGLDKKNPERTWYCAPTDVNEIIVKKIFNFCRHFNQLSLT